MSNLVDIVETLISRINLEIDILSVDLDKFYLNDTVYLTKLKEVRDSDDNIFKVIDFSLNQWVTLEAVNHTNSFVGSVMFLNDITYFHGDQLSVNKEYKLKSRLSEEKTPFIWLAGNYDDGEVSRESSITGSFNVRLFFLDWYSEEWDNDSHNEYVTKPMNNLRDRLISIINNEPELIYSNKRTIARNRFGNQSNNKGAVKLIIDEKLSGVDVTFKLDSYYTSNCDTIEGGNTPICADGAVRNTTNTFSESVPSGEVVILPNIDNIDTDGSVVSTPAQTPFTCTPNVCEDATQITTDTDGSVLYNDTIPSGGSNTRQIQSSTITDSLGNTRQVVAEGNLSLSDIELLANGSALSDIPALLTSFILNIRNTRNSNVGSEVNGNWVIGNSTGLFNGNSILGPEAEGNKDIVVRYENGTPVGAITSDLPTSIIIDIPNPTPPFVPVIVGMNDTLGDSLVPDVTLNSGDTYTFIAPNSAIGIQDSQGNNLYILTIPSGGNNSEVITDATNSLNGSSIQGVLAQGNKDIVIRYVDQTPIGTVITDTDSNLVVEIPNPNTNVQIWTNFFIDAFVTKVSNGSGGTIIDQSGLELLLEGLPIIPNILITPNGVSATKLHSIIGQNTFTDMNWSRGTTGTRRNESGVWTSVGANIPRANYEFGGTVPAILHEPQRSNVIMNSSNPSINNGNVNFNVTTDTQLDIFGNLAYSFNPTNNGYSEMFKNAIINANTEYTFWMLIKENARDTAVIRFRDVATISNRVDGSFDLSNNTITTNAFGTYTNATGSVQDFQDGWKIVSITFTSGANNAGRGGVFFPNMNNTNGMYLSQFQVEDGAYPTTPILTTTTMATRLADVGTGSGTSSDFNSQQGVLYAYIRALDNTPSITEYLSISDGTYNNRLTIAFAGGTTDRFRISYRINGLAQIDTTIQVTDITAFNKIAFKWAQNDFAVWVNGQELATDNLGNVLPANTLNNLSFTEIGTTTGRMNCEMRELRVFQRALTDTELTDLTTI